MSVADIQVINTTIADLPNVLWLFEQALKTQGHNGYKVWDNIDKAALERDIKSKLQYKVVTGDEIICIFSVQFNDPFIWRERDNNDSIYLHRIVVNSKFKGKRLFERVLKWSKELAIVKKRKFIRMDTWADNQQLINYYMSFGFRFIENYTTSNTAELPIQNRNLNVALLELTIPYDAAFTGSVI